MDEDKIETKELARLMTNALKAMPDCASCNLPIWDKHVWPQGGLPRFAYLGAHRPLGCTAQISYLELARCKAMRKLKNKEDEAWKTCEEFEDLAPEGIDFATWDLSFTYKASRCKFHGVRFGRLIRGFEVEGMKVCCTELRGLACGSPRFFINETKVYHGSESLSTQFIKWRKIQQSSRRRGDTLDQDRPCICLMGDTLRPQGWTSEQWDRTLWNVWGCLVHGYTFATFEADPCCNRRARIKVNPSSPSEVIRLSPAIADAFKAFLTSNYVYPEKDVSATVEETPLVKEADVAFEHLLDEDDPNSAHKGSIKECVECARLEHHKGHKDSNWRVCPDCAFASTQETFAAEHDEGKHVELSNPPAACPRCFPGQAISKGELRERIMREEHAAGRHATADHRCPLCVRPVVLVDPELERMLVEEEHIEGKHVEGNFPFPGCSVCEKVKHDNVIAFTPVENSDLDRVKQELLDNINGNATMAQDVLTSLGNTQSAQMQKLAQLEETVKSIQRMVSQVGDTVRTIQIGLQNDREKARIEKMTAPKYKAYDLVTTVAGPWLGQKLSVVERQVVTADRKFRYLVENMSDSNHDRSWFGEEHLTPWVDQSEDKFKVGDHVARVHRPDRECEVLEVRHNAGAPSDYRVRALGGGVSAWFVERELLPWNEVHPYKYALGDQVFLDSPESNLYQMCIADDRRIRDELPEHLIRVAGTNLNERSIWVTEDGLKPWSEFPGGAKFKVGDFVMSAPPAHWAGKKLVVRDVRLSRLKKDHTVYDVERVDTKQRTSYYEGALSPWKWQDPPQDYLCNVRDYLRVTDETADEWFDEACMVVGRGRKKRDDGTVMRMHYVLRHPTTGRPKQFDWSQVGLVIDREVPSQQANTTGDAQETEANKETLIVYKTYFCTAYNTQTGKIYEEGKVVSAKTADGAKLKIAVKLNLPDKVDIEDVTITALAQSPN